jgi:two-component system CheB/CheR fusion protein
MTQIDFPIIGIGASAGGLEPLELFFRHINNDAGFAYLIIQHLAPHHKSLMDELLARHTNLPIFIMEDGMEIQKNTIYLNPPAKFVGLENKTIRLFEKADKQLSFPITSFFHSLSDQWEDMATGIILSGTGSDGSEGIRFIKEKGGLVLVQTPESAKFDGMPKNAIASGCVDIICEPENMPQEIQRFFNAQTILLDDETTTSDVDLISQIINIVFNITGVDFSGYKITTVHRRITKRMFVAGYSNLVQYLDFIKFSAGEAQTIAKELLIGVTKFFRDEDAFEAIKNNVIPHLVKQAETTKNIRIWVTACSTGEEAYSIAIILKDYLKQNKLQLDVSIFATDLDKTAIKTAGNRVFPESIATEIGRDILQSYFIPSGRGFRIAKEIRDMIIFSVHNLIQDPPFSKIDLVTCRNFLIYLKPDIQQQIFSIFRYTIRPDGFLFLGHSESLGTMADYFQEYDKKSKIFINSKRLLLPENKFNKSKSAKIRLQLPGEMQAGSMEYNHILQHNSSKRTIESIHRFLIQQYVPDSVIFTAKFDLVHTTGRVSEWLKVPSGEMSFNILKMLPAEWLISFEIAANKTIQSQKATLLKNVKSPDNLVLQKALSAKINIRFNIFPDDGAELTVATFEQTDFEKEKVKEDNITEIDLSAETKERLILLEQELRVNKENLQTTIEELESSNEELQAANEELQSSNEELESVNEELYTVNSEYQAKVEEMESSTNDIRNLLTSTDIAILFLDEQLNIRRYTPAIKEIFHLMPQDIGRHIIHFRGSLQLDNFIDEIEKVNKTLIPFECAIRSTIDNNYMMRISPFRTEQNEIKGIVISFTNITSYVNISQRLEFSQSELNKLNEKYKEQSELFELISNNASDLISVNLPDGIVEYISPSLREITSYHPEELLGKTPFDMIHADDKESFSNKFFKVVNGENVGLVEFRIKEKNGEFIWLESSLRPILSNTGKVIKVLNTARNINLRKYYEKEQKKLSVIAKQTANAVIVTDEYGYITFANEGFERMTGFLEEEVLGKKPGHFLHGKETNPETVAIMREAIHKKEKFDVEVINYDKSGSKYWLKIHCEPTFDNAGNFIGFFALQTEITPQKEYEAQIEKLNTLLKNQNKKLEESNKLLEEFAYIASHDLKEPIRMVNSFLGLLKNKYNGQLDDKAQQYIHFALDGAHRMAELIDELLAYSRLNIAENIIEKVDTRKILQEVVSLLAGILEENQATVNFDQLPAVFASEIELKLVFQNLIGNALKYHVDGVKPIIDIKAEETNELWTFSIKDNGIGINKEYHKQIFHLFKRLHNNSEYSGTGMGLATCKKIIDKQGGRIWVESEEGKGSTFYFTQAKYKVK